ncbi:MAG TPA: Na+/H+ antiporter NhaA [Miltoncostaeaceae bacterium]|nr:Na+/H+ antiporter NhaA [Miltoncostaeaceae bacterium]
MTAPPDPRPPIRMPWSRSSRAVPRLVVQPLQRFLHLEISGGLVLLAATAIALAWANVATGGYHAFWTRELTLSIGDWSLTEDLRAVVNDGLMALFFLVIGLEVKRELTVGELSSRQAILLPLFAALGGMLLPAAIFLLLSGGGPEAAGWGIPMATDLAFALGALAALGRRVPPALMAFLLGVAVIDDIGAILVVAVAYTAGIQFLWLAGALAGLGMMFALRRVGVRNLGPYIVLGFLVWFATFESGVHATIAGVAIGLLTPVRPFQDPTAATAHTRRLLEEHDQNEAGEPADAGRWLRLAWLARETVSPLTRLEHSLHPWSSFVVLPIFALANAGIVLNHAALTAAFETPLAVAVGLSLVVGKALGLTGGAALAIALGITSLPRGVRWSHMVGVGTLAGIGFTVSLFISELAYDEPDMVSAAKIGVFAGSLIAAGLGVALLLWAGRRGSSSVTHAP